MRISWLVLCLLVPVQACQRKQPAPVQEKATAPAEGNPRSALGLQVDPWARGEIREPDKRQWLERTGVPFDSSRLDDYHILDLNADGRPDVARISVACSGENCVAEEMEPQTSIYLATGTRFVASGLPSGETLLLLRQAPWQAPTVLTTPTLLTTVNESVGSMCESPLRRLIFFRSLAPRDTALAVTDEVDYAEWPGTRFPREPLRSPIGVRVTQDQYNLRSAPVVDDTTSFEGCGEEPARGNVVATFRIGATALALAQQQVGERLWYFVVTPAGSAFTSQLFERSATVRLMGWMSSRNLETVSSPP